MNIVFSILHYQALEMTEKCVESILKIKKEQKISIVIVDNASPNNTGDQLEKIYSNKKDIYVIRNTSNEGFARGNNIGYRFAKEQLHADVIAVMNNDVIIEQDEFIKTLKGIIDSSNDTHIIAPDVLNFQGFHQNPMRKNALDTKSITINLIYNLLMIMLLRIPFLNQRLVSYLENRRNLMENHDSTWKLTQSKIVPHGAIIIYTRNYIAKEDFSFLPITFMFAEEDILYEYATKMNYGIKYEPSLHVLHLEDVSIREITKSELNRRKFLSKHKVKSLFMLLKLRFQL
ncbi:glycosyltransferase [Bacillus infantis]|uniref:glycosyltransferase family 2 protein n=1 Tax=Bacillus infantis TaxID=324767 RepID=UPI001CD4B66A|nr:glycosyltransferase [Bacillus infantis]MCA1041614.1 glycosyltransferase [Bacillus infantis]